MHGSTHDTNGRWLGGVSTCLEEQGRRGQREREGKKRKGGTSDTETGKEGKKEGGATSSSTYKRQQQVNEPCTVHSNYSCCKRGREKKDERWSWKESSGGKMWESAVNSRKCLVRMGHDMKKRPLSKEW